MSRTNECPKSERQGRMIKAEQFWQAADAVAVVSDEDQNVGDAFVTLVVHAGIAAADVICCARLGEHAYGENHNDARALLERADKGMGRHLKTLLDMKTRSGYSHQLATVDDQKRAGRAAETLMMAARVAHTSAT